MIRWKNYRASLPLLCLAPEVKLTGNSSLTKSTVQSLLPRTFEEWGEWLKLVQHNRIETQVYSRCQALNLALPSYIAEGLSSKTLQIRTQNQKRRQEAMKLFSRLKAEKLDVIVLKGNALAEELYHDLDYKQMNDFDLLFQKGDLDRLEQVYHNLNLKTVASLGSHFREQEKYSHHWPLFFSQNLSLFLGTHWNIVNPFSKIKIQAEELWERSVEFKYDDLFLRKLGNEDFLHHLCIHLSPYKVGLKELADIFNFVFFQSHQNRGMNWDLFHSLVKKAGSEDAVYRAFSLCLSIFEIPEMEGILERIQGRVSSAVKIEIFNRTQVPETILYTRTTHISKIEKRYALFSISENPLEKAYFLGQMWKLYLFPKGSEAYRLSHRIPEEVHDLGSLFRRVFVSARAPGVISRAFMADLGVKVFVLVTLNHHIVLARSFIRFLFKMRGPGLKAKARSLGLNLADMKSLSALE